MADDRGEASSRALAFSASYAPIAAGLFQTVMKFYVRTNPVQLPSCRPHTQKTGVLTETMQNELRAKNGAS